VKYDFEIKRREEYVTAFLKPYILLKEVFLNRPTGSWLGELLFFSLPTISLG